MSLHTFPPCSCQHPFDLIFDGFFFFFYRESDGKNETSIIHNIKINIKMAKTMPATQITSILVALLFLIIEPFGKFELCIVEHGIKIIITH